MNAEISKILIPVDGSATPITILTMQYFLQKIIKYYQLISMHAVQADQAISLPHCFAYLDISKMALGDSIVQTIKQDSWSLFNGIKQKCNAISVKLEQGQWYFLIQQKTQLQILLDVRILI